MVQKWSQSQQQQQQKHMLEQPESSKNRGTQLHVQGWGPIKLVGSYPFYD